MIIVIRTFVFVLCYACYAGSLVERSLYLAGWIIRVRYFIVDNLLIMYFLYELRLIPIVWLVLMKGYYPNRVFACLVMFSYTVLFRVPLVVFVIMLRRDIMRRLARLKFNYVEMDW